MSAPIEQIIEAMWKVLEIENIPEDHTIVKDSNYEHSFEKLLKLLGWRKLYDLLISLSVCALKLNNGKIDTIEPLYD